MQDADSNDYRKEAEPRQDDEGNNDEEWNIVEGEHVCIPVIIL